jgi:hypothetical protein
MQFSFCVHLLVVVFVVIGVEFARTFIITSQRFPVYVIGQVHWHVFESKVPPFKHESNPHLQIGKLHILGHIFASIK